MIPWWGTARQRNPKALLLQTLCCSCRLHSRRLRSAVFGSASQRIMKAACTHRGPQLKQPTRGKETVSFGRPCSITSNYNSLRSSNGKGCFNPNVVTWGRFGRFCLSGSGSSRLSHSRLQEESSDWSPAQLPAPPDQLGYDQSWASFHGAPHNMLKVASGGAPRTVARNWPRRSAIRDDVSGLCSDNGNVITAPCEWLLVLQRFWPTVACYIQHPTVNTAT